MFEERFLCSPFVFILSKVFLLLLLFLRVHIIKGREQKMRSHQRQFRFQNISTFNDKKRKVRFFCTDVSEVVYLLLNSRAILFVVLSFYIIHAR